ncbi:MAG: hypothetical protein JKY88_12245 [Pseudomonadales bacterium]|nr:hypothetical protein [Pseudomonadales bacterium]
MFRPFLTIKSMLAVSFFSLMFSHLILASSLTDLQRDWALANYVSAESEQDVKFESLIAQAELAIAEDPNNAELFIWQGIILSTAAGKAGGLSALGLIKDAKASLEHAIEIDASALNGSAYTSLGALYYQVPGWPIAFGSDKKARKFLEKSLTINPDGIDPNFFYGEFLIRKKDYKAAAQALNRALSAAPRAGREIADEGRRKEIIKLLAKINS